MQISSALFYATELKFNMISLMIIFFLNPCPAFAQIYKWVDENGRVHFGDKPQSEAAEMIKVDKTPPEDRALNEQRKKQQKLLDVYSEERAEAKDMKAKAETAQQKRKANCERARKHLTDTKNARFLFEKTDDPDNPHVYSNDERKKAEAKAQADADHWCNAL